MAKAITPVNAPNNTRNFYPSNDLWRTDLYPVLASTALAEGTLLAVQVTASSPTGNVLAAATTNTTGQNVVGILAEPITASDADYATAGKLKLVHVPISQYSQAYFTVISGTFSLAQVGRVCQIAGSGTGLAVATNGLGAVIDGFISSTRGTCKLVVPYVVTA
jgi:hypothetical protein